MDGHSLTRTVLPVVLISIALGACGREVNGSPGSTASPTGTATITTTTTSPRRETTGPEKPQPPGKDPYVVIPTLPNGEKGNHNSEAKVQCIHVAWLGKPQASEIPSGLSIVVTEVNINPGSAFAKSNKGCDGLSACASYAFTSTKTLCSVSLTATGYEEAELTFKGHLTCPANREKECSNFVDKIDPKSIFLDPRSPPESSTTTKTS